MTNDKMTLYQAGQLAISDLRNLAADFAKSRYFQDAQDAAQAVVKIQAGIEMGFGPVYSMTKIYIVKGRVMVSAEAMGAMVKRSNRYDYTVKTLTDQECVLDFTDNGKTVYTSTFTMKDAARAKIDAQDSGWQKWPRAMLMSKALSQGARIVCPHVIAGVYTPADFAVETDEAGEPVRVIEAAPVAPKAIAAPAKPAPPQTQDVGWVGIDSPAPQDKQESPKPKRDLATLKTITDMQRAVAQDFGIQPAALLKELNLTKWADMAITPTEGYQTVAATHPAK